MKVLGAACVLLLVAAVVFTITFAKLYRVPGFAMSPSLRQGDRIIVFRFVGPIEPDQGDIVAYNVPGTRCGLRSSEKVVFVHRLARITRSGRYVMLGDDRRHSCDSRAFGPVFRRDLIGEVVAIYWTPRHLGLR